MQPLKKKKVHDYFQFRGYKQRMQLTVTAIYFLESGFACYCKMAALTLILCAHWALCLPPLSEILGRKSGKLDANENEKKLIS